MAACATSILPRSVRSRCRSRSEGGPPSGNGCTNASPSFEPQAKLLGDIHARIPMVTIDELVEVKVENAEADERRWSSLRGMHEGQAKGLKQVAATAERGIAENRSAADNAAANAARQRNVSSASSAARTFPAASAGRLTSTRYVATPV